MKWMRTAPADTIAGLSKLWIIVMTQTHHRPAGGGQIVFWDGKVGTTPPRLRADAIELLCFGAGSSLEQLRRAALEVLQAHPWATVVVANRWAPLFMSLAAENLQLCLDTAFLYRPAEKVRMGRESYGLPLSPMAFRSVVIAEGEAAVTQHINAWKSLHIPDSGAFIDALSEPAPPDGAGTPRHNGTGGLNEVVERLDRWQMISGTRH